MRSPSISIRHQSIRGFTLIEILVVVGIFAILATYALFLSMDFYRRYSFRSERDILVNVLQRTRTRALSNINASAHGVRIEPGQYTIFQGSYNTSPDYEVIKPNYNVTITTPVSPSPLDIIFQPLTGDTATTSVTLSSDLNHSTIWINPEGRISY